MPRCHFSSSRNLISAQGSSFFRFFHFLYKSIFNLDVRPIFPIQCDYKTIYHRHTTPLGLNPNSIPTKPISSTVETTHYPPRPEPQFNTVCYDLHHKTQMYLCRSWLEYHLYTGRSLTHILWSASHIQVAGVKSTFRCSV